MTLVIHEGPEVGCHWGSHGVGWRTRPRVGRTSHRMCDRRCWRCTRCPIALGRGRRLLPSGSKRGSPGESKAIGREVFGLVARGREVFGSVASGGRLAVHGEESSAQRTLTRAIALSSCDMLCFSVKSASAPVATVALRGLSSSSKQWVQLPERDSSPRPLAASRLRLGYVLTTSWLELDEGRTVWEERAPGAKRVRSLFTHPWRAEVE